jgi:hypothetical protein
MGLGIRELFKQSENTQRRQGQLDVVKDNAVPPISAINPILAPVESVGKVAVGLTVHTVSWKFDEELKGL